MGRFSVLRIPGTERNRRCFIPGLYPLIPHAYKVLWKQLDQKIFYAK